MIKNIIFDFDGVICESVDIKTDAFYEMYLPYGEEVALKVKEHHIANGGMSRYDKFRHYEKVFLDKKELENLLNNGINEVRLMYLGTIRIFKEDNNLKIEYIGDKMVKHKIHWASYLNTEEISLLTVNKLDLIKEKVIVEKEALLEDIFQAERIGFIKNEKDKEQLIFMHN